MNDRPDRIESTIQFILDLQAQAEARRIEHEARHADYEARQAEYQARQAEYQEAAEARRVESDREIKQIRRVLLAAIRSGRRERTRLNEQFRMLADSQMRTDAKMQIFLDYLRKGNGNTQ